ncbi:hypothetical protein [Piscinibacter sp.]|uniref:hypothetical protein n=1 Tax=Piscinibacter sp. TaxID=1903157 RepID=UPI002B6CE1B7|nr:hypothetical protein [Albitalea sp.]HUG21251.1 hypothetical protein [Albitalea sp.]
MTHEPPVLLASPNSQQATQPAGEARLDGSVEDHHLDDQPAQSQGENLADQPGLLPVGPHVKVNAAAMCRPRPYVATELGAPYLDGPQRPPCANGSVA